MISRTMDLYGRLDILVNNVGISMAYPSQACSLVGQQSSCQYDHKGTCCGMG